MPCAGCGRWVAGWQRYWDLGPCVGRVAHEVVDDRGHAWAFWCRRCMRSRWVEEQIVGGIPQEQIVEGIPQEQIVEGIPQEQIVEGMPQIVEGIPPRID